MTFFLGRHFNMCRALADTVTCLIERLWSYVYQIPISGKKSSYPIYARNDCSSSFAKACILLDCALAHLSLRGELTKHLKEMQHRSIYSGSTTLFWSCTSTRSYVIVYQNTRKWPSFSTSLFPAAHSTHAVM